MDTQRQRLPMAVAALVTVTGAILMAPGTTTGQGATRPVAHASAPSPQAVPTASASASAPALPAVAVEPDYSLERTGALHFNNLQVDHGVNITCPDGYYVVVDGVLTQDRTDAPGRLVPKTPCNGKSQASIMRFLSLVPLTSGDARVKDTMVICTIAVPHNCLRPVHRSANVTLSDGAAKPPKG
ncbi:hypothetical protein ACFP1Z_30470 [Streptomyces gamaensis]|uniref:Serine/threonine protein kinase n=1 Tax=Streptomyces gamaensis TaxID=1763542 RepID=A0ABW0ZC01_9ACTN